MAQTPARRDPQLRVLDLTAPARAPRVDLDVSPAYELLIALEGASSAEAWSTYDQGAAWFDGLRSRMSPDLLALVELSGDGDLCCRSAWAHLAGLASEAPRRADAEAVVDHLAALPVATVYRALLESAMHGPARRQNAEALDLAAGGDRLARERLREVVAAEGEEKDQQLLTTILQRQPDEVRDGIITGLREAATLLRDYLAGVVPALRHDAEARRERIRGLPVEEAVEVGTAGIHWRPEPGIRRVLLIPHAAMRPWVVIGEHGDTKIFMVAVAEESLSVDLDTPPPRLLTLFKALAEEQRLRILRRLASGGPASLQQLADHIGVAKSTAHHHLVHLRAAGLTVVDLGEDRDYRLRDGLAADVAQLLDAYLRGTR